MSFEAMKWAKGISELSSSQKFVLIALSDFYNDAKRCAWPSIKRLMGYTNLSRRTVQRSLAELERQGLIKRRQVFFVEQDAFGSSEYALAFNDIPDHWPQIGHVKRRGTFAFTGWHEEGDM